MPPLDRQQKDEIYRRTKAAVERSVRTAGRDPADPAAMLGMCLEWAWEGYRTIKAWPDAPRTIIQAGSAQWPRIPEPMDDGVSPTHFAYEFQEDSHLVRLTLAGVVPVVQRHDGHVAASLPELHVWLGCPETQEIIDFTTGCWPATCKATTGLEWFAKPPPEYLWCRGDMRPDGANYRPSRKAIELVSLILQRQERRYP